LRQTLFARIFANFSKAKAMDDVVTESELAKARNDPTFRQQFLARNLGLLLEALKTHAPCAQSRPPKDTSNQRRGGACKVASRPRVAEVTGSVDLFYLAFL
jgi:hypothetical protein